MGQLIPTYDVELTFTAELVGASPMSQNLIHEYMQAIMSGESNPLKRAVKEQGLADEAAIRTFVEKSTGLHYHDSRGYPYIPGFNVAAMLFSTAKLLGIRGAPTGALGKVLSGGLILPHKIGVTPASGYEESDPAFITRATQPWGQTGYRQPTLSQFEAFHAGAKIGFNMGVMDGQVVNGELLKDLFEASGISREGGLGGHRKLGYGKFVVSRFQESATLPVATLAATAAGTVSAGAFA